jgi:ATP-binding cassette, subfamily B, bacterial
VVDDDEKLNPWIRIVEILKPYWGVWSVVLAITFLQTFLDQVFPQIQKNFIDLISGKSIGNFWGLKVDFGQVLMIWLLALIFQTIFGRLIGAINGMTYTRVRQYLRQLAYTHLLRLPLNFFQETQSGKIMSQINRGTADITSLVGYVINGLLPNLVSVAMSVYFVSKENRLVGLAVLLMYIPYVILRYMRFRVRKPLQEKNLGVMDNESGRFVQALGAIRLVKSFAAELFEEKVFWKYSSKIIANVDNLVRVENKFVLINLYSDIVTWSIYLYIGYLGINGLASVGAVVLMIAYVRMIKSPIMALDSLWWEMSDAKVGAIEYVKILNQNKEEQILSQGNKKFIDGDIEFSAVDFGYDPRKKILNNLNFRIGKSKTVAIVGKSGEGKSTIVNLLLRFYNPTSGQILIGGVDISQLRLEELRSNIGVVMQDVFLFDDTVLSNLNYGRKYKRSEVIKALKEANAWEFVQRLPQKLDTIIGERGIKLSGGQKQRLSIARTLLSNPSIIVFDEATSSLDNYSEKLIQETLANVSKNRTIIIIAHRLSTVRFADEILVMESGKIVERGKHATLMKNNGLYAFLIKTQDKKVQY